MKYVDEYRDPQLARGMLRAIREKVSRRWVIMDVCGGQTHNLLRSGLDEADWDITVVDRADTTHLVDEAARMVALREARTLSYDYMVIA